MERLSLKSSRIALPSSTIAVLILVLPLLLTSHAELLYSKSPAGISITGYVGSDSTVEIPSQVEGAPVIEIAPYAFSSSSVTNVLLPETMKTIGHHAFYSSALRDLIIPDSVTEIGNMAFGSSYLTKVKLPSGLKTINDGVFYACGGLRNLVLPPGVTNIGNMSFGYCRTLQSISIPDGVISIDFGAFYVCQELSTISIPDSVISIGDRAFQQCYSLTNFHIGNGLKEISVVAFEGSGNLQKISVTQGNSALQSIDGVLFDKAGAQLLIYPPARPAAAYEIPAGVTSIRAYAFAGCKTKVVRMPESIVEIGEWAFLASELSSVTISPGLRTIPMGAFSNCGYLTAVTIPRSVTTLSEVAFSTSGLTNILVPSSVTNVGPAVFYHCVFLERVEFEPGVAEISQGCFAYCDRLTTVLIPETVRIIGSAAFHSTALAQITLPKSLETIADGAFYGCPYLQALYFLGAQPTADPSVFWESSNCTIYYLPGTRGWQPALAGRTTAAWVPFLTLDPGQLPMLRLSVIGPEGLMLSVETSTNIANSEWTSVGVMQIEGKTASLDLSSNNHPVRFYRLRFQ